MTNRIFNTQFAIKVVGLVMTDRIINKKKNKRHQTQFFLIGILSILFISNPSFAADEDIVVYTDLKGHHSALSADFRAISKKSIDNLNRFKVINGLKGTISGSKPLKDRLQAAAKGNVPWVADVILDSEKKTGKLQFQIFRNNGELIFRWEENYKIKSIKAFLAQLEYSMPLKLKTKFLELGRVIKKDKRLVYFDLGETAGIKIDDTYQVYEEGDPIEDDDGNSYGNLEVTTGIVRVKKVTAVYSIAEIIVGQLSIDTEQWVKRTTETEKNAFDSKILAVLENQIAINIGKNAGVEEGSYYGVFRDIKTINDKEAFRQPVGHIKVNEVFENFSKGELSISETYDLSKFTIAKGDRVEEVESPRKNMWGMNQMMTNVNGSTSGKIATVMYQRDSLVNVSMVYRLKAGMGTGSEIYASGGVMQSMGHSDHVFIGMDLMYIGGTALNLFISVDVDTPVSNNFKINLESGFIVAHENDTFNGLNTSIGIKYAYDLF